MVYFWCHAFCWYENWILIWKLNMHKCVFKRWPWKAKLFNQAEYIFIAGQLCVREIMKDIKRCTSPIKLPFIDFQNFTLNFGPFKSTLLILSHKLIFSLHLWQGGNMWCMWREGLLIQGRRSEWQCAGILCQQILLRKTRPFQLILPAERKKKQKGKMVSNLREFMLAT